MALTVKLGVRCLRVFHHLRRIEKSQAKPRGKQALDRRIDILFIHQAQLHGVQVFDVVGVVSGLGIGVDTFIVYAGFHRNRSRLSNGPGEMVGAHDFIDRITIGDHVAVELPGAPKLVLEQKVVSARRIAVDAVVGAHDGFRMSLDNRCSERGQVRIFQVVFRHHHIDGVPNRFRSAVDCEVFGGRDHAKIFRIVALHSTDESHTHAAGQERILAVCLLIAPPTRIASDIDIGRPEV